MENMRIWSAFVVVFVLFAFSIRAQEATPTPIPGDINYDGIVSHEDLLILQKNWMVGQKFTPLPTPNDLTIMLPGEVPLVVVRIPAGSFLMGSSDESGWSWCPPCEQPVHWVDIPADFYLGKYEITQAQWLAVMGSWPDLPPSINCGKGDNYPAYNISWNDCQNFIAALNLLDLGTFRLPSEAEWEYACRAGTTTRFSFGDSNCELLICDTCDLSDYGWWCANNVIPGCKPAGGKLPNPFGLYDMHGNIGEWIDDDWHGAYVNAPNDGEPWIDSPRGSSRVFRSGHWYETAGNCRSSYRSFESPDARLQEVGIRLVWTPQAVGVALPTSKR